MWPAAGLCAEGGEVSGGTAGRGGPRHSRRHLLQEGAPVAVRGQPGADGRLVQQGDAHGSGGGVPAGPGSAEGDRRPVEGGRGVHELEQEGWGMARLCVCQRVCVCVCVSVCGVFEYTHFLFMCLCVCV